MHKTHVYLPITRNKAGNWIDGCGHTLTDDDLASLVTRLVEDRHPIPFTDGIMPPRDGPGDTSAYCLLFDATWGMWFVGWYDFALEVAYVAAPNSDNSARDRVTHWFPIPEDPAPLPDPAPEPRPDWKPRPDAIGKWAWERTGPGRAREVTCGLLTIATKEELLAHTSHPQFPRIRWYGPIPSK